MPTRGTRRCPGRFPGPACWPRTRSWCWGLITIVLGSSLVMGLTTPLSVGDTAEVAPILKSGLAYPPAELVLGGLALALYGLRPRLFGAAWAGYAALTFIAFLGPGLKLRQGVLDLSPTTHVGNPPAGAIQSDALAVMAVVAVALLTQGSWPSVGAESPSADSPPAQPVAGK